MNYRDFGYGKAFICKQCGRALFNEYGIARGSSGVWHVKKFLPGSVEVDRESIICQTCGSLKGKVVGGDERHELIVDRDVICIFPDALGMCFRDAIFACGCFWGVEYQFKREEGIVYTAVGYCGGDKEHPTYEEVKTGRTGHKEAIHLLYDPVATDYERLVRVFFEIHDFTQKDGQGPDIGSQYLSYIFYLNDEQKKVGERYVELLKGRGYDVVTKVEKAGKFWVAEDYHQDYYDKMGATPYCHTRKKIFD